MIKVSILSNGLGIFPSRAFLLPIVRYREELEAAGIKCTISRRCSELDFGCDVLIIEDNALTRNNNIKEVLGTVEKLAARVDRLLWFDTDDSTGTITRGILLKVDGYYKKQLLRDRDRYCEPLWRSRTFTDYYYENYDIDPIGVSNRPQIESKSNLQKLGVFWNLGHEIYLPMVNTQYKNGFSH